MAFIQGLPTNIPVQAAFDPRVRASVCFFATDIHTATLGKGDDSLERVKSGALTGPDNAELVVSGLTDCARPPVAFTYSLS